APMHSAASTTIRSLSLLIARPLLGPRMDLPGAGDGDPGHRGERSESRARPMPETGDGTKVLAGARGVRARWPRGGNMNAYTVQLQLKPKGLQGISDAQIEQHWALYEGYVRNVNALLEDLARAEVGSR